MNLIPEPQEIIYAASGVFRLPDMGLLSMPTPDNRLNRAAASILSHVMETASSGPLFTLRCGGDLSCQFKEALINLPDAYSLHVAQNGLCVASPTAAGLFYGIQTLRQLVENTDGAVPCMAINDWAAVPMRCDHFDLRTVHPTFPHLLSYIEEMSRYKVNALLIEYEDKFPFRSLRELRHPHSLTEGQIRLLLDTAHNHFIQIIPLQQSYGHLEYVLKHPACLSLRELPDSVAELCPQKPGSYELVCRLIRDMAEGHPDSVYLHLGGDEVWSIGSCRACRETGLSKSMLYIRFINRLAAFTLGLGKKPIIWHDMLKDATDDELKQLDKRITVAVWIYSGRRMEERSASLTARFQAMGLMVLGAPSVRCWDECAAQNYPVAEKRLENMEAWINTTKKNSLKGLIFTNWSASLALGNPYGLFETTRYLTFLACERSWKPGSCQTTYPARFFFLHHGIREKAFLQEELTLTDYYKIPELYRPLCSRNEITARLLEVMRQYEEPAKSGLPLQDLLFRGELFPENEEIITFLKEKFRENYEMFDKVKPLMQELFEELLPPHLTDLYLTSRFYLPEAYRRLAEDIFGRQRNKLRKAAQRTEG